VGDVFLGTICPRERPFKFCESTLPQHANGALRVRQYPLSKNSPGLKSRSLAERGLFETFAQRQGMTRRAGKREPDC